MYQVIGGKLVIVQEISSDKLDSDMQALQDDITFKQQRLIDIPNEIKDSQMKLTALQQVKDQLPKPVDPTPAPITP